MEDLPRCFVAYPSLPAARAEALDRAIDLISNSGVVDIDGWRSLSVGGRPIITRITEKIQGCQCFVADLTGLNPNVLFELGYAVAHRKRVWLLLDAALERAKLDFDRFQLFTTIAYQGASNSQKIVEGFFADQPYVDGTNLCDELLDRTKKPMRPTLLYIKAQIATEASNQLARRVAAAEIASVIDDPAEYPNQTVGWYINRVDAASAVVCHLLSSEHASWEANNAKQAFVAGLAQGFGKPLLMLAHAPYSPPLDYRDLLRVHDTAARAADFFNDWFALLVESIRKQETTAQAYKDQRAALSTLEQIDLGDWIAENESDTLTDYFIPTASYKESLRSSHSIFIGRKGTGKSATFFKLDNELRSDPRNHVCQIKPIAYELEGIVQLLSRTMEAGETGYLIESLWKFLISTELAKGLYSQINSRPAYYGRTPDERAFLEFVDENASWITPEFSIRLESSISRLLAGPAPTSLEGHRRTISEKLHGDVLPRLKTVIGNLISGKNRVIVLIDNLDKAWDQTQDLSRVSDLLFGLLSVSGRIASDFDRDPAFREKVHFSLILFLRSDIYAAIIRYAHERDKVPVRRMFWDDQSVLLSVLEERFMRSELGLASPEQIWQKFFTATVGAREIRKYLTEAVLPRPRDLLYLVKTALQFAINRGHGRIEEDDLLTAEIQYSHFALNSLMAENAGQINKIERLLAQFSLSPEIVNELDVLAYIERADVHERPSDVLNFLCELAFLGLEVEQDRFEFLYDEEDMEKLNAMATRSAVQNPSGLRRYRINSAYHRYLEVKPSSPPRRSIPLNM
ncbi:MAG TPA: hypothetical protein VIY49_10725 [Bryobacteraceae bacterium]